MRRRGLAGGPVIGKRIAQALVFLVMVGALWFLVDALGLTESEAPRLDAATETALLEDAAPTLAATGVARDPAAEAQAKAEAEAAAAAAAEAEAALEGWVLEGRVVNERRQPVAEAAIEARMGLGDLIETTSDADGRFVVALGEMPEGEALGQVYVYATAPGPLAGMTVKTLWGTMPSKRVPLEPLVLGKGQRLEVHVKHLNAPLATLPPRRGLSFSL